MGTNDEFKKKLISSMQKLSLSIPGFGNVDSGVPAPTGGLFDEAGKAGTGINTIRTFIELFLVASILIALYFIAKGGLDMITSEGEKEKLKRGRERFIYALVGLAFVFLSFTLINIASTFFGFNLLPFSYKPAP